MLTLAEGIITKLIGLEKTDDEIPEGATIVGANGVFKTSKSPIFNIIKPTNEVFSGFKEIEAVAEITKKVPWDVFWMGPAWLKKQWNTRRNVEYIILLFYHPEREEYFWHPPVQKGSSANLNYYLTEDDDIRKIIEDGAMLAGTMHNHFGNKGSAFQSHTDSHDEQRSGAAGVHWTMGYMDCKNLFEAEFHVRIVSGNFDREIKMSDCVESPKCIELPEEWDDKLDKTYTNIQFTDKRSSSNGSSGYTGKGWKSVSERGYGSYGTNVPYYPSFRGSRYPNLSGSFSKHYKGSKGSNESPFNQGDENILGDITVLNSDPTDSAMFDALATQYDKIMTLAKGEEVIRAMALARAVYEGGHYAVNTDEFDDEEREDRLVEIIEDMCSGAAGIFGSLKEFCNRQTEIRSSEQQATVVTSQTEDDEEVEEVDKDEDAPIKDCESDKSIEEEENE